jgi:hypothetical protein
MLLAAANKAPWVTVRSLLSQTMDWLIDEQEALRTSAIFGF